MMYHYLDRSPDDIDRGSATILHAMRDWVAAVQSGRCPCRGTAHRLGAAGLGEIAPDFGMMMFTLNGDGLGTLRFAPPGRERISDDEARLLALLDMPVGHNADALRRLAAGLVEEGAVTRLTHAVAVVASRLAASGISTRFER